MNIPALNIAAAVQASYSPSLVTEKSRHVCAKSVRTFLQIGGLPMNDRPDWAWKYMQYLPKIGFSYLGSITGTQAQSAWTSASARPGDIAVYFKPGAGTSEPGHICMWNGKNWASDFRQNNMSVYSAPVEAHIFRWSGRVTNFPVDLSQYDIKNADFGGDASQSGEFNGNITFSENLTGEELAKECPDDIKFKGMWSIYQLKFAKRTQTMKKFITMVASDNIAGLNMELNGDLLEDAVRFICMEENGIDWDKPLDKKFIVGYKLPGEAHKTYGFGLMYGIDENGRSFLMEEEHGGVWPESEQRNIFRRMVAQHLRAIEHVGLGHLGHHQKIALSHRRHFGPGPFNQLVNYIKANGGRINSVQFKNKALEYCMNLKNWDKYGRGWTNGINREAALWARDQV